MLLLVKEVRSREDSDSSADSDMESDSEGGKESNNPAVCDASGGGGEPSTTFRRKFTSRPMSAHPRASLTQLQFCPCARTP